MKLYRKGKVKEVYETENGEQFEFLFTDQISVFDKVIPSMVPRKGESLCRTAAHWFDLCSDLGYKTHFIDMPEPNRMRVKKVNIITDYDQITPESTNFVIPLEVIARYYAAGSFLDRIKDGRMDAAVVGFEPGYSPKYGEKLPKPLVEFTTKFEEHDRPLTEEEAMEISKLSREELDELKEAVLKIDLRIEEEVESRGLIHCDGKKEFAYDENRELMLIDTFATADEDRFWDKELYEQGELKEQSKELIRKFYRESGYHSELSEARKAGGPEPDIPPLPQEMIDAASKLYSELYEKMTGKDF